LQSGDNKRLRVVLPLIKRVIRMLARDTEILRAGAPMLKKVRQLIESVNDTLKGQLDLERHGARTAEGVSARVAQRVLALAAAIWHNFHTSQPISRSLTAYDH
jgi:hypothetical protein